MMSRRIVALLLAGALAAAPALAQEPPALPPQSPRQPMSRLSPQQDAIQLIQGERLVVSRAADGRFEIKSAGLVDVNTMNQGGKPAPGQIVFSFAGSASTGMLLKIESGLDYAFRYRAVMLLPGPDGQVTPKPTSMCVVHPKIFGMEHWPQPIAALVLSNFEKAPDEAFDCR